MDDAWVAPTTWFGTAVIEEAPPSPTFLPPAPEYADELEPAVPDLPIISEYVVYSEHYMSLEPAIPTETGIEAPEAEDWLMFAGGAF